MSSFKMNTEFVSIISLTLNKMSSLLVGTLSIYLGYKLLMANFWGEGGDVESQFGDTKIILRKPHPLLFSPYSERVIFHLLSILYLIGLVRMRIKEKQTFNVGGPGPGNN